MQTNRIKTEPKPISTWKPPPTGLLRRTCACGSASGLDAACDECRQEHLALRRRDTNAAAPAMEPSSVHDVLRTLGQPLEPATRALMESRFGHDFSRVRVHTDARSAESARALHALAYTVGPDVVFGAGQYAPSTNNGRRLLAHELTHVVQQHSLSNPPSSPWVGVHTGQSAIAMGVDDAFERQADNNAQAIDTGAHMVRGSRVGVPQVQRAPLDNTAMTPIRRGGTLPYREANEWLACIRIMGKENEAYCRREVLGETVVPEEAAPGIDTSVPEAPETAEVAGKKVCLTFDDGPQNGTEDVLNALGGRIPAAFFLTGKNMASNLTTQKRLVERMLSEGHQIGNHTYTHDPETGKGYEEVYGDLSDPANLQKFQENYEKNERHFRDLLGATSPVFTLARLPGQGRFIKAGGKLIFVVATEGLGMAHVTWHFEFAPNGVFSWVPVPDWKQVKGAAASENRYPRASEIILFHDRHWAGANKALLEGILHKLMMNSFTFGKLDEAGKCT